jgi:hypothetical protein
MPRRNGSYFGLTVNPTPSVASGIWRVREAEEFLRVHKWPATPGVPGSPVGSAGNAQVSLTWSAPTLGTPPTDYHVQYSSNSGSTWTTFAVGTSTATSAVVTGLTNGTGYIFRVRAVNALGEGPYGAASGVVTPSALDVALLLHFDGTNGSTTFTDSSPSAATFGVVLGSPSLSSPGKFGSAAFSGNGGAIASGVGQIPDLTADWTAEAWVYRPAGTGNATVVNLSASGGAPGFHMWVGGDSQLRWDDGAQECATGGAVPFDQWSHIAACRSGGVTTIYIDGIAAATTTIAAIPGPYRAFIGAYGDLLFYSNMLIDELRVVKGTAVYTANFTPPTAPF